MRLRAIFNRDLPQLEAIHAKYFSGEFPISDLASVGRTYAVFDEGEKLITAGGIRTIVEGIIVTDKDIDVRVRKEALILIQAAMMNGTMQAGYDQLHAFVQDEKWKRHLIKNGFTETKGQSLVIGV